MTSSLPQLYKSSQSYCDICRSSVVKQLTEDGLIPVSRISPSRSHSPLSEMGKSRSPARTKVSMTSVHDLEDNTCKLNPKVEGRVIELTPEVQMTQFSRDIIQHIFIIQTVLRTS